MCDNTSKKKPRWWQGTRPPCLQEDVRSLPQWIMSIASCSTYQYHAKTSYATICFYFSLSSFLHILALLPCAVFVLILLTVLTTSKAWEILMRRINQHTHNTKGKEEELSNYHYYLFLSTLQLFQYFWKHIANIKGFYK